MLIRNRAVMRKKSAAGAISWVDPDDAPELKAAHFENADLYDGPTLVRREVASKDVVGAARAGRDRGASRIRKRLATARQRHPEERARGVRIRVVTLV
jgi:hypothetical protein